MEQNTIVLLKIINYGSTSVDSTEDIIYTQVGLFRYSFIQIFYFFCYHFPSISTVTREITGPSQFGKFLLDLFDLSYQL